MTIGLFQSTPPHGGRHAVRAAIAKARGFQSTPPHGGRLLYPSFCNQSQKFQSTPPHGGRHLPDIRLQPRPLFQSTPPHGGRLTHCLMLSKVPGFNPRPRMGGDGLTAVSPQPIPWFQSTPPHGGRQGDNVKIALVESFNPRPRMGGDDKGGCYDWKAEVSIHAPAWGATRNGFSVGLMALVSIHAPAWGATKFPVPVQQQKILFQSTPPGGRPRNGDLIINGTTFQSTPACGLTWSRKGLTRAPVSIHAPAWGRRPYQLLPPRLCPVFNPPPAGGRRLHLAYVNSHTEFQSTGPRIGAT